MEKKVFGSIFVSLLSLELHTFKTSLVLGISFHGFYYNHFLNLSLYLSSKLYFFISLDFSNTKPQNLLLLASFVSFFFGRKKKKKKKKTWFAAR
jgi:hypothetical protein